LSNGSLSVGWGLKRPGCGDVNPPSFNAKVKQRVDLHLYCPSVPSLPAMGMKCT